MRIALLIGEAMCIIFASFLIGMGFLIVFVKGEWHDEWADPNERWFQWVHRKPVPDRVWEWTTILGWGFVAWWVIWRL